MPAPVTARPSPAHRFRPAVELLDDRVVPSAGPTQPGLLGTYFDNRDFTGPAVRRADAQVAFDWKSGAPIAGIAADTFSVRWEGWVTAPAGGDYVFRTYSDDGVRVWVDGRPAVDQWNDHAPRYDTAPAAVRLAAGQRVAVRVDYYENGGGAVARLEWRRPGAAAFEAVPATALSAPTPAAAAAREEYEGYQPGWVNARAFGAAGDGVTDDTAALQRAIDEVRKSGGSEVLYLPPGTYRVTDTLKFYGAEWRVDFNNPNTIRVQGEDPLRTTIRWAGAAGGTVLDVNGLSFARFNRFTVDGGGKAGVLIEQAWSGPPELDNNREKNYTHIPAASWEPESPDPARGYTIGRFDSAYEYADLTLRGGEVGFRGGARGYYAAELSFVRLRFEDLSKIGLVPANGNALNLWVWDSEFVNNYVGVGTFAPGAESDPDSLPLPVLGGQGNVHVRRSAFRGSKQADIAVGWTQTFGFRDNYSVGSHRFFYEGYNAEQTSRSNITLQGNRVVDTTQPEAVRLANASQVLLIDNQFVSRPEFAGRPVVHSGNPFVNLVSVGNTFTTTAAASPYDFGNYAVPGSVRLVDVDNAVVDRGRIDATPLVVPLAAPKMFRPTVRVTETTGAAVQRAIDEAVGRFDGQRPIVYLPAGTYRVDQTIVVPADADVQLVGEHIEVVTLAWAGEAGGTVVRLDGPSKAAVRDLKVSGSARASSGVVVADADQPGARVLGRGLFVSDNIDGLVVERTRHANVELHDSQPVNSRHAGVVAFGPGAGDAQAGRLAVFGATINNQLSAELVDDAHFVIQDSWAEFHTAAGYRGFLKASSPTGRPARATVNAVHMGATEFRGPGTGADVGRFPMLSFADFAGRATVAGNEFSHSRGAGAPVGDVRVELSGGSPAAAVAAIANATNNPNGFRNTSTGGQLSTFFNRDFTKNAWEASAYLPDGGLFGDAFEGGPAPRWQVPGGALTGEVDGSNVGRLAPTAGGEAVAVTPELVRVGQPAADYAVAAWVKPDAAAGKEAAVVARYQGPGAFYAAVVGRNGSGGFDVRLRARTAAGWQTLGATAVADGLAPDDITADGWLRVELRVAGDRLEVRVSDTDVLPAAPLLAATNTLYRSGRAGLLAAGAAAVFDDVRVDDGREADEVRAALAQLRAERPTDLSVPATPAGATDARLTRVTVTGVKGAGVRVLPGAPAAGAAGGLLANGGFEGLLAGGWDSTWGGLTEAGPSAGADARTGQYALRGRGAEVGGWQRVTGLQPNTTYRLAGWLKAESAADAAHLYAEGLVGRGRATGPVVTAAGYTRAELTFTTGPGDTSAVVGVWKPAGAGMAWADDLELVVVGPAFADDFAAGPRADWQATGGTLTAAADPPATPDGTGYRFGRLAPPAAGQAAATVAAPAGQADQAVTAWVRPAAAAAGGRPGAAVVARYQGAGAFYAAFVERNAAGGFDVSLRAKTGTGADNWQMLSNIVTVGDGEGDGWLRVELTAAGDRLEVRLGDADALPAAPLIAATDGRYAAGRAGLLAYHGAADFDDVLVTGLA